MNQDNDKQESGAIDPQVSALYDKLADERTPADIDRAVLHEAARAVRADNRKGSFGAWFRPVAFMVMVGLSLAIVLDLSDTSIFSPPADLSIDALPPASVLAPVESAMDAVQRNRPQSAVSEMKRQKRAVSTQALTVDEPDNAGVSKSLLPATEPVQTSQEPRPGIQAVTATQEIPPEAESPDVQAVVSDAFTVEVERAEQGVREAASTPDYAVQPPGEAPAASAQFIQLQPADTMAAIADPPPVKLQCFEEEKLDPDLWWECIESLRQEGANEFADRELENLRKAFPEFAPPE